MALRRRREANPLDYWSPTPPQREYLASDARMKMLRGPNQSGKTQAGCIELLDRMRGVMRFQGGKRIPKGHYRVICYSWDQSKAIERKVADMVPPGWLHPDSRFNSSRGFWTGQSFMLKHIGGGYSLCEFLTLQAGAMANASATLHGIWVDEPPKPEVWSELVARVEHHQGPIWLTMTPSPWQWPVDWLRDLVESGQIEDHHFRLTPENCTTEDGRAFKSQQQIDNLRANYLPSEIPMRIDGEWDGPADGVVFEGWDEQRMVSAQPPNGKVRLAVGLDHGSRIGKQCAVLVAARGRGDTAEVWVLDEVRGLTLTDPQQDAQNIVTMLKRNRLKTSSVDAWVGDRPHGGNKMGVGKKSNSLLTQALARVLSGSGQPVPKIRTTKKYPGVVEYHARVMHGAMVRGSFHVHPRCASVVEALSMWAGRDDEYKDVIDALRYGAMKLVDRRPMASHVRMY